MEQAVVEHCALSGSDLKIKFRVILLTSILQHHILGRFLGVEHIPLLR